MNHQKTSTLLLLIAVAILLVLGFHVDTAKAHNLEHGAPAWDSGGCFDYAAMYADAWQQHSLAPDLPEYLIPYAYEVVINAMYVECEIREGQLQQEQYYELEGSNLPD